MSVPDPDLTPAEALKFCALWEVCGRVDTASKSAPTEWMLHLPLTVVIMAGTCGAGKSTVAEILAKHFGFHLLQTDRIRKEMAGLSAHARTSAGVNEGIYSSAASEELYRELTYRTRKILYEGNSAILDGTYLTLARRAAAVEVARSAHARSIILHCALDRIEQTRRIEARVVDREAISEGTVDVMRSHERVWEPILPDESDAIISIDTGPPRDRLEYLVLVEFWRAARLLRRP